MTPMPNEAFGLALGAALLIQDPPSVTWHGAGHMLLFDEAARLAVAMVAGGLLGLNRNLRGKAAGMRTHALVALGAAMVTAAASHAGDAAGARPVMQGVITGIGFVGAGVILHPANAPPRPDVRRNGTGALDGSDRDDGAAAARRATARHDVRGLTTAASVWVAAGLGVTSGLGLWSLVMFGALFALAILSGGGAVEDWVQRRFRARLRQQRAARRERRRARVATALRPAPLPAPPPPPPPAPRA